MFDIRRFELGDFPIYQPWFCDRWLNRALGPMTLDDPWLEALNDPAYAQFSIFREGALVAVAGFQLPPDPGTPLAMIEFAVQPALRGQGVGRGALRLLRQNETLVGFKQWMAYVSNDNPQALYFFTRNGWVCDGVPDEDGMQAIVFTPDH